MIREEKKDDIILEQWKTCVEMANSVSKRRDTMNNIFVTLNLAIVTAVSINWNLEVFYMLFPGIVLCIIWILMLRNYKLLNTAKFNVINAIEKELPFAPFKEEWEHLKNSYDYVEGTALECSIPVIFIIMYVLYAIIFLIK